jgi:hypothetical protein
LPGMTVISGFPHFVHVSLSIVVTVR